MMDQVAPRTSTFVAVAGVAMGIFGLLTSFWIPTLASMLAVGALVSSFTQIRDASSRRSLARVAIALGIGTVLLIIVVVLLTSGSSSGDAVTMA